MNRKGTICLIGLLTVIAIGLCGCKSSQEPEQVKREELFTFGSETVYLDEGWIYAKTIQQEYERVYGKGIWTLTLPDEEGNEQDMETITKDDIIDEIIQVKILSQKSEDYKVNVSLEEQLDVAEQAKTFVAGLTDKEKQETGITEETAIAIMEENLLAKKVYEEIVKDSVSEISDENARMTTVYDMIFPKNRLGVNDEVIPLDEEDLQEQLAKAQEAHTKLLDEENEESIESIARGYGLNQAQSYTMTKEAYEKQYGAEITNKIYEMRDGDYSEVIESDYGYHIFKMVALTDDVATQKKKREMKKQKEEDYFKILYNGWYHEMDNDWSYVKNVNEEAWNKIHFAEKQ